MIGEFQKQCCAWCMIRACNIDSNKNTDLFKAMDLDARGVFLVEKWTQLGVKIHWWYLRVRSLLIPNSDGKNVNTTTALVAGRCECCESAWTRDERRGNERKTSLVSGREREIFLCLPTRWLRRRLDKVNKGTFIHFTLGELGADHRTDTMQWYSHGQGHSKASA
jgi:hypothetical protein